MPRMKRERERPVWAGLGGAEPDTATELNCTCIQLDACREKDYVGPEGGPHPHEEEDGRAGSAGSLPAWVPV